MEKLTLADLSPADAYAAGRGEFRMRVSAHQARRRLALGEHLRLQFHDRLTLLYQAQESLRLEGLGDELSMQRQLAACNLLMPDGDNLKATLSFDFPDPGRRRQELARLAGIEHHVYAEVEGLGQSRARVLGDAAASRPSAQPPSVHWLRFDFSPDQVAAIHAGADFGFGIDDDRLRVGARVGRDGRAALLADFD